MTKQAHTPGPWAVADCAGWKPVIATADDTTHIATLADSGDEAEANARLIAAAPDMLEALRRLMAFVEAHTESGEVIPPNTVEHVRARAAIAKAEGAE